MKHLLCILICISSLVACTSSPDTHFPRYSYFTRTKALRAQVINLDTILLRYPFRVTVRDSIAVVMDLHNIDNYLHAFTYPTWKHIASFGKRGEAPEEMLSAANIQFNSLDSLWALDPNKMEISRWKISLSTGTAERVEKIKLDKKLVRSLDFRTIGSGFLIPDYLGEHRFWEVNNNGEPIKSNGTIPSETIHTYTSRPALAQAWRSFMDFNPDNGVLAMATQLGETIEIYNLNNNTHKVLYGPAGEPKFQTGKDGSGIPSGIMGFSDIKVTKKHIYAVFQGIKFKDKLATFQRGERPEDGGRFIYVFDLEGNPVCKYTLDHPVYGIDINEETNTIVATEVESDDPIIEFKI